MTRSEQLFEEAVRLIPGGVNSPVRAFAAVGTHPRFIRRADRQFVYDVDDTRYLDFVGSWGPMMMGHNHPVVKEAVLAAVEDGLSFGAATEREVEMARFICGNIPSVEMVRMVNSGTEAVMSAVRAARGFTGRDKIIKFEGCYHGHSDAMLVKAGSGVMTAGVPSSAGVPGGCARDTLAARYNDLASVERLFEENPGQIAAVILEPVAANMGLVLPKEGFLQSLRALCDREKALLIFDEVITGFRLGFGGAQEWFGVTPDLTTFGKIIGAGMPVGAYGGRRDVMEVVSPCGPVYQAGTLSGNPVAMAAGLAQLRHLKDHPEIYRQAGEMCARLTDGLAQIIREAGEPAVVNRIGSLGGVFFTSTPVTDYDTAKTSDTQRFGQYFRAMLSAGCYFAPSQFEVIFLSGVHTAEDIDYTLDAARRFFLG